MALSLVVLILVPIILGSWAEWKGVILMPDILNSIFLCLIVGLAEELIFRGWLWGELHFLLKPSDAVVIQATIFSLVHVIPISKSDIGFHELIFLLTGLFLLGLILALRRVLDKGSLGGCIGLHGGLVSLWFFSNADLISISQDTPTWLIGPGGISPNPIGSTVGVLFLALMVFFYRNAFAIAGSPFNGARNASSKGAIP